MTIPEGCNLMPCPFCGGGAKLTDYSGADAIFCENAGVSCQAMMGGEEYMGDADLLVKCWNTRAPVPPQADAEPVAAIRAAAKEWFYQTFDDDVLEQMEKHKIIAQAEGFSTSVMAELELDMEAAFKLCNHPDSGELARLRTENEELRAKLAIISRKATEYACESIPTGPECRFGDEIAALATASPATINQQGEGSDGR